jgi:hypothetical protein
LQPLVHKETEEFQGFSRPQVRKQPGSSQEEEQEFSGFSRPRVHGQRDRSRALLEEDEQEFGRFSRPRVNKPEQGSLVVSSEEEQEFRGFSRPSVNKQGNQPQDLKAPPSEPEEGQGFTGFSRPQVRKQPPGDASVPPSEEDGEQEFARFSRPRTGIQLHQGEASFAFHRPKPSEPRLGLEPKGTGDFTRPGAGRRLTRFERPTIAKDIPEESENGDHRGSLKPDEVDTNLDTALPSDVEQLLREMSDFKTTSRGTERKVPGRDTFKTPRANITTEPESEPKQTRETETLDPLDSILRDLGSMKRSVIQKRTEQSEPDKSTNPEVVTEDSVENQLENLLKARKRVNPRQQVNKPEPMRDGIRKYFDAPL